MPRAKKPPRLYLYRRRGQQPAWYIRDGGYFASTGCGEGDRGGAEKALAAYITQKHRPDTGQRDPAKILICDILTVYGKEVAPGTAAPERIGFAIDPLLEFFAGRYAGEIRSALCRDYVAWRTAQGWRRASTAKRTISVGTARRELECLQAAINHYGREYGLAAKVSVQLPRKPEGRTRWLTRKEAAALLRAARANRRERHLARFILIGLYTGTRHSAILKLRWLPSPDGGWFDLERGVMYRRGSGERVTNKRRTPSRIPPRLMPHLKRWRRMDIEEREKADKKAIVHVVSWAGKPIAKERRAWASARAAAGLGDDVTPHVLRHTAATWLMQAGVNIWTASGFLAMSAKTLETTYSHHHPDFQEEAASAF